MYLSRIIAPQRSSSCNKSSFHKLVMWGFPRTDDPNPRQKWGVLHRVDGRFILVQSKIEPVWPALLETEVKSYEPVLRAGKRYQFRLAINPVIKVIKSKWGRSPVDPITWLESRDLGARLEVCNVVSTVTVERSSRSGNSSSFPLTVATLDGVLECSDPDRLQECIVNGIGRGRAYGCGLLSVVPV